MPVDRTRTPVPAVTVVAHDIGPFGGMESQLAELVAQLLARGVEVVAIGGRVELDPHPNLLIVRTRLPQRPFPLKYAAFFALGTLAVARYRRGSVYTIGAITFNRADARKIPFCHIAWSKGDHQRSRASRDSVAFRINSAISGAMSRAAERLLYRPALTSRLVAMSTGDAAELDRYFPRMAPSAVIPNGIDTDRFAPNTARRWSKRAQLAISEDELLAAFVGGDWQRKGLPQVIEALARAPRWQLAVAGEGDRDAMTALASQLGVDRRVRFLGRVTRPEDLLAAADALAMPSVYEPWGNAVLEACATGLPVVVAAANGVKDFIDDGSSGIVVEPDARSVADALNLLADAEARERLGRSAIATARGYSYERVADDYLRLFAEISGPQPASPTLAAA